MKPDEVVGTMDWFHSPLVGERSKKCPTLKEFLNFIPFFSIFK